MGYLLDGRGESDSKTFSSSRTFQLISQNDTRSIQNTHRPCSFERLKITEFSRNSFIP